MNRALVRACNFNEEDGPQQASLDDVSLAAASLLRLPYRLGHNRSPRVRSVAQCTGRERIV